MRMRSCWFRGVATVALLSLSLCVAACGALTRADQLGPVQIDAVDIGILESFPVQIHVVVKGSLPDGCTLIDTVDQRFDANENIFWIEITIARTGDDVCTEALVPFEETVPLDVYGLSARTYVVDVNGVRETFVLEVDNVLPDADNVPSDSELPNPASRYCVGQGYVNFSAPINQGFRYATCGRTGVGGGEIIEKSEAVVIAGQSYSVTGFEFIGEEEPCDALFCHNETFFLQLPDGTRIEYGATPASDATYDDYVATTRQVLLQIVASFVPGG